MNVIRCDVCMKTIQRGKTFGAYLMDLQALKDPKKSTELLLHAKNICEDCMATAAKTPHKNAYVTLKEQVLDLRSKGATIPGIARQTNLKPAQVLKIINNP